MFKKITNNKLIINLEIDKIGVPVALLTFGYINRVQNIRITEVRIVEVLLYLYIYKYQLS